MGIGSKWELSVLPAQFCCEPKTALKNEVYFFKNWREQESLPPGSNVRPERGHMRTAPSAESARSSLIWRPKETQGGGFRLGKVILNIWREV